MPTAYLGNVRTGEDSIWWISFNSFCPQCQSEKARFQSRLKCMPVGFMPTKIVSHGQDDFHPWKKSLLGISFRGWTFLDRPQWNRGWAWIDMVVKTFLAQKFHKIVRFLRARTAGCLLRQSCRVINLSRILLLHWFSYVELSLHSWGKFWLAVMYNSVYM